MNDKELSDSVVKFITETEGKRPTVNDPRARLKTRDKLSKEELENQAKATEVWSKRLTNK